MAAPATDKAAVKQVIRALKSAGYVLQSVFDGEEDIPVSNETEAIEAIFAVDQAHLHLEGFQWVFFVLGNDPEEVVNDYTVKLDPVILPLFDKWEQE